MTTLREAAQQALEALGHVVRQAQENLVPTIHYGPVHDVMNNLRAALAQQTEPVDTDCHTQGICQRSGYGITQQAEPVTSCGWLFRRNADGTIGIFAPPPKPGESQRTSDCVGPNNHDLHELLGKLADHMAALAQQAEPNVEYERGFIDGMQMQTKSSVDRAVNRMAEQAMLGVWQDVPGAVNFGIKE